MSRNFIRVVHCAQFIPIVPYIDHMFVGTEQQKNVDNSKLALLLIPFIMLPNYNRKFVVTTDACATSYGSVLSQLDDERLERPIPFH